MSECEYYVKYTKIAEINLSALFSDCFMKISLQSSEQIYCVFVPTIGEKIFMKQSVNNADKLTSVIFVHKALH